MNHPRTSCILIWCIPKASNLNLIEFQFNKISATNMISFVKKINSQESFLCKSKNAA